MRTPARFVCADEIWLRELTFVFRLAQLASLSISVLPEYRAKNYKQELKTRKNTNGVNVSDRKFDFSAAFSSMFFFIISRHPLRPCLIETRKKQEKEQASQRSRISIDCWAGLWLQRDRLRCRSWTLAPLSASFLFSVTHGASSGTLSDTSTLRSCRNIGRRNSSSLLCDDPAFHGYTADTLDRNVRVEQYLVLFHHGPSS